MTLIKVGQYKAFLGGLTEHPNGKTVDIFEEQSEPDENQEYEWIATHLHCDGICYILDDGYAEWPFIQALSADILDAAAQTMHFDFKAVIIK